MLTNSNRSRSPSPESWNEPEQEFLLDDPVVDVGANESQEAPDEIVRQNQEQWGEEEKKGRSLDEISRVSCSTQAAGASDHELPTLIDIVEKQEQEIASLNAIKDLLWRQLDDIGRDNERLQQRVTRVRSVLGDQNLKLTDELSRKEEEIEALKKQLSEANSAKADKSRRKLEIDELLARSHPIQKRWKDLKNHLQEQTTEHKTPLVPEQNGNIFSRLCHSHFIAGVVFGAAVAGFLLHLIYNNSSLAVAQQQIEIGEGVFETLHEICLNGACNPPWMC